MSTVFYSGGAMRPFPRVASVCGGNLLRDFLFLGCRERAVHDCDGEATFTETVGLIFHQCNERASWQTPFRSVNALG
jgi:hypothetical protein